MKTYVNFWLLCFMLLFLAEVETHAQRFYFKTLFNNFVYKYGKKQTQTTFEPTDKLYNHQWELTVDGVLADSDVDCLHVGKQEEKSQIICLATTTPFKDVDLVRVSTDIADRRNGRGYEVRMTLGSDKDKSDTCKYTKKKKDSNNNLSNFYITKGKINSGTLTVEMKGDNYEKGALYLYFIEVASVLSGQQKLQTQHIKPGETYSYQVQRTFASDHWNTICLPFDVSKEALKEAMGNCTLLKFTKKIENNVLQFKDTVVIEAGVPYLIKPVVKVKNPIFSNVVYQDVKPQTVQDETGQYAFVGTFDPVNLSVDGSELFLLANGNLAKPKSEEESEMYGMRAYFKINKQTSSSAKQITYAIDCGSETVNGIQLLHSHPSTHNQHIYNLQGVEVGTDIHYLPAGVYVMGGKTIIKR
ncbi:hypothetical protein [Hoylesella timonensis]|uniref:Uncharacterized protein n=1 Tax=Hoylesella timonensis S9-PR14 TaxID=1401062 RepID=A0A098YRP5_9BACT|nr:hypothetical protein [Hoylesella timonensis]KGI22395.1 hypothetical protein HMPREF9304_04990 [Hoylesella timonensis S9-PR14]